MKKTIKKVKRVKKSFDIVDAIVKFFQLFSGEKKGGRA